MALETYIIIFLLLVIVVLWVKKETIIIEPSQPYISSTPDHYYIRLAIEPLMGLLREIDSNNYRMTPGLRTQIKYALHKDNESRLREINSAYNNAFRDDPRGPQQPQDIQLFEILEGTEDRSSK